MAVVAVVVGGLLQHRLSQRASRARRIVSTTVPPRRKNNKKYEGERDGRLRVRASTLRAASRARRMGRGGHPPTQNRQPGQGGWWGRGLLQLKIANPGKAGGGGRGLLQLKIAKVGGWGGCSSSKSPSRASQRGARAALLSSAVTVVSARSDRDGRHRVPVREPSPGREPTETDALEHPPEDRARATRPRRTPLSTRPRVGVTSGASQRGDRAARPAEGVWVRDLPKREGVRVGASPSRLATRCLLVSPALPVSHACACS